MRAAAVRAHRNARHALHAAGDGKVNHAAADLGGKYADRFKRGRAGAVDVQTSGPVGEAGKDRRDARQGGALFAGGRNRTHDHFFKAIVGQGVALLDRCHELAGQFDRGCFVQPAVGLAAPAWRADMIVDECVAHGVFPEFRRNIYNAL